MVAKKQKPNSAQIPQTRNRHTQQLNLTGIAKNVTDSGKEPDVVQYKMDRLTTEGHFSL